jgi:hypothetical protein
MKYFTSSALLIAAVTLTSLGWSQQSSPSPADRTTARRLGSEGLSALKNQDFDTAADRFERANDLVSAPSFLVLLGRARVGQGRLVEAYEIYRKIIREGVQPNNPEAFKRALAEAKQEVKELEPRLAWVSVNVVGVKPSQVEVTLNGSVIPNAALGAQRPADPGTLHVEAKAEGYRTAQAEVQLTEGEHLPPIELRMVELPKPEPVAAVSIARDEPVMSTDGGDDSSLISQSALGYVALGLGGAGLAVGTVTGIIALNRRQDLSAFPCDPARSWENNCVVLDGVDGRLERDAIATRRDMRTFATAATISFAAGGALAAAGLLLLITAPDESNETAQRTLSPYVGFGSIGAVGTF